MEQRQGGYQALRGGEAEPGSASSAAPQRLLWTSAIALAALACLTLGLAATGVGSEGPRWRFAPSLQQWAFQDAPVELVENFRTTGFVETSFKREDVAKNMLYTDCHGLNAIGEKVPAEFGGLWWMDGNPAPETVASFGHAKWLPGVEECRRTTLHHVTQQELDTGTLVDPFGDSVPCLGRLILAFWEDRIWAMPDDAVGHTYAAGGVAIDSHMEFVCGGNGSAAHPHFTVCKLGSSAGPDIKADFLDSTLDHMRSAGASAFNAAARFSMVKVSPDAWIRYSTKTNFPYYLKRIVSCSGEKVQPHWDQFNSRGTAKPVSQPDVFGHGADKRSHVAPASDELFVRESTLGTCRKNTGGRCRLFGCYSDRNAECVDGQCLCQGETCAQDGICGGHCHRYTGSVCRWVDNCASEGADCDESGTCICPEGQCAQSGKCVR